MAAKKQPVVQQKTKSVVNKGYVKIPKSVGVIGMNDKVYRRLMIQAIKENANRKIYVPMDKD